MVKLADKPTGTMIVEILGPVTDRNYFSGGPTQVRIQVFGVGSVTLQENTDIIFKGENPTSSPPKHVKRHPDSATWANVGAGSTDIDASSGIITATLTPGTDLNWVRLIIGATPGDGKAVMATEWS